MREPVEELFSPAARRAYPLIKMVVGTSMRVAYDITIEGLENVPSEGAAILAPNHVSFLDSFFIPAVVPRRVTYLAKADYWDSWKTRWFFETVGQIPVRREDSEKSAAALEAGIKVLSKGGLLGIYPEGTRSPDGRLYKGKTGVARMALKAGCPVVPIGLTGTDQVMPKDRKMPRLSGKVIVRFGEPMSLPEGSEHDPMAARAFVDDLMYRIMSMSGQEYVDAYAGKPRRTVSPVEAQLTQGEPVSVQ